MGHSQIRQKMLVQCLLRGMFVVIQYLNHRTEDIFWLLEIGQWWAMASRHLDNREFDSSPSSGIVWTATNATALSEPCQWSGALFFFIVHHTYPSSKLIESVDCDVCTGSWCQQQPSVWDEDGEMERYKSSVHVEESQMNQSLRKMSLKYG